MDTKKTCVYIEIRLCAQIIITILDLVVNIIGMTIKILILVSNKMFT